MKRAVAFCQNIAISKELTKEFNDLQDKYFADLPVHSGRNSPEWTQSMLTGRCVRRNVTGGDVFGEDWEEKAFERLCGIFTYLIETREYEGFE